MGAPRRGPGLRIQAQGRAYAAVIGVTVGMLIAGLAIPFAFGTTPSANNGGSAASPLVNLTPQPNSTAGPVTGGPTSGVGPLPANSAGAAGQSTAGTGGLFSTGNGSGAGGGTSLTASDVGVTPTTIKVGIVLLDLSQLTPLGLGLANYDTSTQQQAFDTYIAQANAAGGFYGRKIVPIYATLNPLDSNGTHSAAAICRQFTEDDHVFAVAGFTGDAGTCAAVQFHTPDIVNQGDLREFYQKSNYYIIGGTASLERIAEDWVGYLDQFGLIKGKKIGLLDVNGSPSKECGDAIAATLKALGYTITYRADLNGDESQFQLALQQMQAAGVNAVLIDTDFVNATQWVQQADGQNWKPQYFVSDIGNLTSDGLVGHMSSGFDGALGVTETMSEPPVLNPEPTPEHDCRLYYNNHTSGKDFAWGEESPLYPICMVIEILSKGLHAAGTTLTRAGMVTAIQGLGSMELPAFGQGSFRPHKTDFSDQLRLIQWHYSCKCYSSIGKPSTVRY